MRHSPLEGTGAQRVERAQQREHVRGIRAAQEAQLQFDKLFGAHRDGQYGASPMHWCAPYSMYSNH